MYKTLLISLILIFTFGTTIARADSQVFELRAADPNEVLATIRSLYGDQLRAEVIRQRLVVVGTAKQIAEIEQLLEQVDQPPAPLRLTLSETPPVDEIAGYSVHTTAQSQQIDTLEGANVTIEKSLFGERAASAGWWVQIEQVPVQIESLMLRIDSDGRGGLTVSYSFARHENGERRVYGNRVPGREGVWIPLLPRLEQSPARESNTVYSSAQAGQRAQLYLKVEKITGSR